MSNLPAPRTNWLGKPLKSPDEPSGQPKSKNDIGSRHRRWYNQLFRFVKSFWWIWLIGGLALLAVILSYISRDALNFYLSGLQVSVEFLFRLIFALSINILMFVGIFWFMARSKTEVILPGDPKSLTLDDYKGQKQLVKLVKEWISLLSDRTEFQKMGGNFINGLLLYGPPGTGKTMLAKCMAGEAGIAFMSMEGSGFRAMFFGVDVLKMIAFCNKAKKLAREYGACIAYIDEIDAVGASRGGVMGGGGMMGMMGGGSGSLTRLLYEMDGIGEVTRWEKLQGRLYRFFGKKPPVRNWHVLYMGSTNRPDVLDPALTRPGRFDRSIEVSAPDKTGRREIVQYYLSKITHDETVDVEAIVADTNGATPERIMSAITKDSVRIALFSGKRLVGQRDIDLAFQEQYFGIENPIEEMEEDQKRVLAYHEAGHAVVQHYVMPDQRIVRVSIIRRGRAYGYVLPVDTKEWHIVPLRRFVVDMMVSLAGRAAENVFFGEPFASVGGDYANIRNNLWVLYVSGMFGPPLKGQAMVSMMAGESSISQGEKDKIIEQYWRTLETQVENLLRAHASEVHSLVNALLERSDLSGTEALEIMENARLEAIARGEHVPEGLPPMMMQLLPEHQRQPAKLEELEPAPAAD
ncbi:MAG: AAA family ATPase [Chloroflexi bacterium]|nr:AAA family ATPase [Chloroflexota bacterium]